MHIIPKKKINLNLNSEQEIIYSKIKKERLTIFLKSIFAGILVSHLLKQYINYSDEKCYYISLTLLLTNLFYLLHPKSIYLLSILKSKDQIDAWLEYYKYMQWKSKIGILLSGIATIFILK